MTTRESVLEMLDDFGRSLVRDTAEPEADVEFLANKLRQMSMLIDHELAELSVKDDRRDGAA